MSRDEQAAHVGAVVSLYTIDATGIGGRIHRFAPGPWHGAAVAFGGVSYPPTPIEIDGIAYGGGGAVARPRLTLSRLDATLVSAILATDSWRGAKFTRLRTLAKYLDGEPGADSARRWPPDVYRIERRSKETKDEIVFQLASPLDFDKKQLPGRQVLRDVCNWRYRAWDAAASPPAFDNSQATCPYRGANYFDAGDVAVTAAAQDKCSQRLTGCLARYPSRVVPFGGFAGVGRFRG